MGDSFRFGLQNTNKHNLKRKTKTDSRRQKSLELLQLPLLMSF